ncbi:hypothetical protein ACJX0J_017749, partial [Zea mays]
MGLDERFIVDIMNVEVIGLVRMLFNIEANVAIMDIFSNDLKGKLKRSGTVIYHKAVTHSFSHLDEQQMLFFLLITLAHFVI